MAVAYVLEAYHTRLPAIQRGSPSYMLIGKVNGKDLKVWVAEGTDPPLVKSVAWRDEE